MPPLFCMENLKMAKGIVNGVALGAIFWIVIFGIYYYFKG
jgi:hypothetical protein